MLESARAGVRHATFNHKGVAKEIRGYSRLLARSRSGKDVEKPSSGVNDCPLVVPVNPMTRYDNLPV